MTPIDKVPPVGGGDKSPIDRVAQIQSLQQYRRAEERAAQLAAKKAEAAASPAQQKSSIDEFQKKLEKLNRILDYHGVRLSFGIEQDVFYLKVIDLENGEVVKQVPSEEMMKFMQRVEQEVSAANPSLRQNLVR